MRIRWEMFFFAVSEKVKRFNDFEEIHVKFEDNLANVYI